MCELFVYKLSGFEVFQVSYFMQVDVIYKCPRFILAFIFSKRFILVRIEVELESIPVTLDVKRKNTLDGKLVDPKDNFTKLKCHELGFLGVCY